MTAPPPFTPPECDLRDFPFTPMFRARLFGSTFHAHADDSEWRAGVTLWLKSWDQVPAGSLPGDDVSLCRLAELGRDVKTWRKLKERALHGWIEATDGRLYHPVVAEGINDALQQKAQRRVKTAGARIAALEKKITAATNGNEKVRLTEEVEKIRQALRQDLSQITGSTDPKSVTDLATATKRREGNGREGKGREGTRDKDHSVANATGAGAPPPSPLDVIFALGVPLLEAAGVADAKARKMLGFFRRIHADETIVAALERCAVERPVEPVSWLQAALKTGNGGTANPPFRETPKQREAREFFDHRLGGNDDGNRDDGTAIDGQAERIA